VRVLLASQEMPPETGWGGIGTYIANLAPALADAGADVHVLSVVPGQPRSDRQMQSGMTVHRRPLRRPRGVGRVSRLDETWERLSVGVGVDRELRALGITPDVVEAPEWRAESLVLGLRRNVPVVVRTHSAAEQLFPYSIRAGLDARLAIALERRTMRSADLLLSTPSNTDSFAGRLGSHPPPIRAVNLPVPIQPAADRPAGAPWVTFVGRLERRKGPEVVIAAARGVLDRVPDARFVFAGADTGRAPGSYRAVLEAEGSSQGVGHALEFLGHLDRPTTLEQIRRSSVCVFPARHETFGYGAAEAASCGVPLVLSSIPAFRTRFGQHEAATIVSGEDPGDWSRAILALLTDDDRARRVGAAGRRRVIERCAPRLIAEQTLAAYEEARWRAQRRR
jgi:glycogen(starch) synthase